jgi:hypothetical protein
MDIIEELRNFAEGDSDYVCIAKGILQYLAEGEKLSNLRVMCEDWSDYFVISLRDYEKMVNDPVKYGKPISLQHFHTAEGWIEGFVL